MNNSVNRVVASMSEVKVLFLFLSSILYVLLLIEFNFYKYKIKTSYLFIGIALLYIYLSLVRPFDFGIDFIHYYEAFIRTFSLGFGEGGGRDVALYFYYESAADILDFFGFSLSETSFKVVVSLWFVAIFYLIFIFADKEWKYYILLALLILFSSRLFWEYSSNTLRSFSSGLLLSVIFFSSKKYFKICIIFLSSIIHLKATLLILGCLLPSYLVAKHVKINLFFYACLLMSIVIFIYKFIFGGFLNLLFVNDVVLLLQDASSLKLHANKINSDFNIQFSLFIQYFFYIFYPFFVFVFFSKINIKDNIEFKMISVLILCFSLFFPEVFLLERLAQFFLLIVSVCFFRFVKEKLFYLPILLINSYTFFILFFESDAL